MVTKRFLEEQSVRNTKLFHELGQAIDPFGLATIWLKAHQSWIENPDQRMIMQYYSDAACLSKHILKRFSGQKEEDMCPHHQEDARFQDPVWTETPFWDAVKETYLFNTRWLQNTLYETQGLTDRERNRAAFWLRQWLNAVSPTNFFLSNPAAIAKALSTQGDSFFDGLHNFAKDLHHGDISMTDLDAFKVGENLATTPGAVVYQGPLLEVIHYKASTPTVHKTPIVIVSPWINKFYVLDLNPKKSFIKYLVDQGFSVFVTSWKNPDASMRNTTFDDYLTEGVCQIVKVACSISSSNKVNLVGYCIGGTLVASYLAWVNHAMPDKVPVESATFLTTLTDFSHPGDIEVFINQESIAFIEQLMKQEGYLDGKTLESSFRMLRSNSLIWNYWVSNYLLGETPSAFDVLFWNMDTTRLPEAMHRFYLHEFYLNNKLIQPNALQIAGQPIDLSTITQPLFMVSPEEDHIAPWKQTFSLVHRVSGPVTFTLPTSGHILGIINPPGPNSKRSYWQGNPETNETPDQWLTRQQEVAGSWWPSWVDWLGQYSGSLVKPKLSNASYPVLCDAPGTYVMEK